jgi:hypothetical protein
MTTNVCENQKTFDAALENASEYVQKKRSPDLWTQMLYLGVFTILIVYALLLASKVKDVHDKVLHFTLAILFSPVYIISHILSNRK